MLCFKAEFLVLMCASFYEQSYNFWQFNMNCYSKVKLHFFQIIYNEYFLILLILTLLQLFVFSSLKSLVSGRNCYIFLRLEKYPLPLPLLCVVGQYMVIDLRFLHEEEAEISVHFSVKFVISPPKTSSLCRSFTAS